MTTTQKAPREVLLIGWDAADWNVARPLMEAGKMPNLQKFCDAGVSGNLATIQPVLSPMLWTSIATGKRAWKHGIHGFSEPCPATGVIRPITNLSRKTKAVWNIFNQQGWMSNVIGWWPSSPAEPINGVMLSNHFQQAVKPVGEEWPMRPGTVHPKRLEEPLKEMRIHPAELENEHILPFIPKAAEIDQEKDKRMESCAKTLAEISSIHAAATACMQIEPWDFMAVYYDGIDHFGHGFMKYHPPRQPWVDEKDFELYQHVIESAYCYHDMLLGTLMALAGEDATVMLISDHGFEPGNLRPQQIPNEPAGPAAEHSPYGIFCLKGPGIQAGEQIHGASLLDITPTLLHLYGLPAGRDMDGKVLVNCFEQTQQVDFIDSWDAVEGDDGRHPAGASLEAVESRESLRQLVDLGYIEEPNPDRSKAIDETLRELQYNLAQAYIDGGLYAKAAQIVRGQWDRWPEESRFGVKLLSCHLALKDAAMARATFTQLLERKKAAMESAQAELKELLEAHQTAEIAAKEKAEAAGEEYTVKPLSERQQHRVRKLRGRAGRNPHALRYFEGSILALEGEYDAAIKVLKSAEEVQTAQRPSLYTKIGEVYYQKEDWVSASDYFSKVIDLAPNSPHARLGLARAYLKRNCYFEAAAESLASLELQYHNPRAHVIYAMALVNLGKPKMAEQSFLTAIAQSPNHEGAYRRLAGLYGKVLKQSQKADEYEALAKQAAANLAEHRASAAAEEAEIEEFPVVSSVSERLSVDDGEPLIVVSGLPRSGTSLMMQMLYAAGVQLVTDGERTSDESNPKGYFEDERVKRLATDKDKAWLKESRGEAIKIVAPLLGFLPKDFPVKVIFMRRSADEVLGSQRKMLERNAKQGAMTDDSSVARSFAAQLEGVNRIVESSPKIEVCTIQFADAIQQPEAVAKQVSEFLGRSLNIERMIEVSDRALYRVKSKT